MADNEFESRQERNERIKNIEYQIEDEQRIVSERRQKEKKRMDRARQRERQKEQREREAREARRNEAERQKAAKKKEQNEAREMMEQKRQYKKDLKNGKESKSSLTKAASTTKNSYTNKIDTSKMTPEMASALASELAKNNVSVDVYVDGKNIAEDINSLTKDTEGRQLPSDLVKRIRREQEKAVKQVEDEILKSAQDKMLDKERIMQDADENIVANNKLRNNIGSYKNASGMNAGISGMGLDASLQNKNVNLSGNYGVNDSPNSTYGSNDDGYGDNNSGTPTDASNGAGQDNNSAEPTNELGMRDDIRANLADLSNRARQNPNGIFMNPDEGERNSNDINRSQDEKNNNDRQEVAKGLGAAAGLSAAGLGAAVGLGAGMAANAANKPLRRTGGTAGVVQNQGAPVEDIDARLSDDFARNMGRTARVAGGAAKKTAAAAKTVTAAMKAKKFMTLGAIIGFAGIIALILIIVVGLISFVMNMPGMVRDKLVDIWDEFWQELKGVFVGQDLPTTTAVKNMAEYLESMGYDLVNNGFATKLEKDEEGNIKEIESKYLPAYISAEQRSYLIANQNYNVKSIWKGITGLFAEDSSWDEVWGTGMIVLEKDAANTILFGAMSQNLIDDLVGVGTSIWNWLFGESETTRNTEVKDVTGLTQRVIIKRDTKEMYISNVDIIDVWNTGGYDVYRFSLKEWTEKYSLPTELSLTLHLATRAPEFAYKFATSYDTKVYMNVKKLENVQLDLTYVKTDQNNRVVLDSNNKPVMIPISQLSDEEIKAKGISQEALTEMRKINTKVTAFTPYITKVVNHWYYQQVIFQGEYLNGNEKKKVDVYQIKNLSPGEDGYERYYAYTRRDNADAGHIKDDTKKVEPAGNSWIATLFDVALQVMKLYFTGGASGISGIMTAATEAAMDEAFKQLEGAVVGQISSQIKGMLPNQLAGMLNIESFLKGNLSFESLERLAETGINLNNMTEYLDFNKITNMMNINNLQMDVTKLWDELNLQNELMNMNLAGLGSINDLKGVVGNLDISNLDKVISDKFDDITNLGNVNFDRLTNQLVGGFESSITSIQSSIVNSCDTLFSGLSEADFNTISDRLLGDVTTNISALASAPILSQLEGSIKGVVNGKFNTEILSGLQNEFSKQLTGMNYKDLSSMASIPDMDFNKLKDVSGQITGISSALTGAENSIDNLSNQVNKLSKDITGMDTKVLNAVSTDLTEIDGAVNTLSTGTTESMDLLKGIDTSNPKAKELSEKVNTLNQKTNQMKQAVNNLEFDKVQSLQNDINTCKNDITRITNTIDNLDEQTIGRIQSQMNRLENQVTNVVDRVTSFDIQKLEALKYKIAGLDKTGLVDLATDLYNLDVSSNGMKNLVTKYGSDLTNLNTSDINMIINTINGQNVTTQQAINRVSGYLMRSDETELASNLLKLNSTINLLNNATEKLDVNTVTALANKIPGFDSFGLNKIASQISNLENVSVDKLLKQVEELPNQLVQQVSNKLTAKITEGVKNQIAANLGSKLENKLLNTGNFKSNLKGAMTSGDKQDIDMETEDQAVEDPYAEYSTGFYVREIRTVDYFQVAEPVRVLYSPQHWLKMFREDKYIILNTEGVNLERIDDPTYVEKYGKTIWDATDGNIENSIYAMLQGVQSSESQYLLRYFKELFNDFGYVFNGNFGFDTSVKPDTVNPDTIGWIFKTAEFKEPVFTGERKVHSVIKRDVNAVNLQEMEKTAVSIANQNMPKDAVDYSYKVTSQTQLTEEIETEIGEIESDQDAIDIAQNAIDSNTNTVETKYTLEITYYKYENREYQMVRKAEYEPYAWSSSKIGILTPKSQDAVYGFEPGLDIVSPVNGVVVAKTEATTNELGEKVSQSVTIELRDTGDVNADGMRIILIGGDYSGLMVGSLVKKVDYIYDEQKDEYTGDTTQSAIGKTTDEVIKIMVLDRDQTPVEDVSDYIYPPYEEYKALEGDSDNEKQQ